MKIGKVRVGESRPSRGKRVVRQHRPAFGHIRQNRRARFRWPCRTPYMAEGSASPRERCHIVLVQFWALVTYEDNEDNDRDY